MKTVKPQKMDKECSCSYKIEKKKKRKFHDIDEELQKEVAMLTLAVSDRGVERGLPTDGIGL